MLRSSSCQSRARCKYAKASWTTLRALGCGAGCLQAALKKITAEKKRIGKTNMSNASKKKALALKKAGKGIFAPKKLSDALAAICGKKTAPRTEVGPA